MAVRKERVVERELHIEGNNGGSFIDIEVVKHTSRDDTVRLRVGHDCVMSCEVEISTFALAAVLTQVAHAGFRKTVAEHYAYQEGEIPTWAEPIPEARYLRSR